MSAERRIPLPVTTFTGRDSELARLASLATTEVLFLICGVAGVGKTELAFALAQRLRESGLDDAAQLHIRVNPGDSIRCFLAELLADLGCPGKAMDAQEGMGSEDDLVELMIMQSADALEKASHILIIDDAHHLADPGIWRTLTYLARHVRRSHIIVTSRQTVPKSHEDLVPVVCSLKALDEDQSIQLVELLAERLQLDCSNPQALFQQAKGNPFYLRRALAKSSHGRDTLADSLAELSDAQRSVLLLAALLRSPRRSAFAPNVLEELARYMLVDEVRQESPESISVHDLVRDTLLRTCSAASIREAHRQAAQLCERQIHTSDRTSSIDVVDTASHYLAADDTKAAWRCIATHHSQMAAQGEDHLMIAPLNSLREKSVEHQDAIDLLRAQCLLRACILDQADEVLSTIVVDTLGHQAPLFYGLRAELEQRRGHVASAATLLENAIASTSETEHAARFRLQVQVALLWALRSHGARSRTILSDALANLEMPTPRQEGLCGWARSLSWTFAEHYESAARAAQEARATIANQKLSDLDSRLAMVLTLACVESDRMQEGRAAANEIASVGLRQPVAALYRSIAQYAAGEVHAASESLQNLYEYFLQHGDRINAFLASYYGSVSSLASGRLVEAQKRAVAAEVLARDAGFYSLEAMALAQQALLAAEAVQAEQAHLLADRALALDACGPLSRCRAHCAHAHAHMLGGDISLALVEIGHARTCLAGPGLAFARVRVDIEEAAVCIVGGDAQRAIDLAHTAARHYQEHGRDYETARAQLILASAHVARGRVGDIVFAEEQISDARTLADRGSLLFIQVGCSILSASLTRRTQGKTAGDEQLLATLREQVPIRDTIYARTLLTAVEGGGDIPGALAFLAAIGLCEPQGGYLIGPQGRRAVRDIQNERKSYLLFVDGLEGEIWLNKGANCITGKPILAALLGEFILAQGQSVPASELYEHVWKQEYHPLRHRNTLYVAISRLRKTLGSILGATEVIERNKEGWRLVAGTDAAITVASTQSQRAHVLPPSSAT